MYNDYMLGNYVKQRHADLLLESEKARLANEAIKIRKASMKKQSFPGWRLSLRNLRLFVAKRISQAFPI